MSRIVEPLVGRSAEVEALDAALEAARSRFVAVAVVGEPGIGKTRLLAELRARADAAGFAVRGAGAAEHERNLPFAVLADALDLEVGDTPLGRRGAGAAGGADAAAGARPRRRALGGRGARSS